MSKLTPEYFDAMIAGITAAARHAGYSAAMGEALRIIATDCDPSTALRIGNQLRALAEESGRQFDEAGRLALSKEGEAS